jgi:hypothetical protein
MVGIAWADITSSRVSPIRSKLLSLERIVAHLTTGIQLGWLVAVIMRLRLSVVTASSHKIHAIWGRSAVKWLVRQTYGAEAHEEVSRRFLSNQREDSTCAERDRVRI